MRNIQFAPIKDAYQLVQGAKIKGIKYDEIFELGAYDPNKRGYTIYPYEDGVKFNDFSIIVNEKELKTHYLIEDINVNQPVVAATQPVSPFTDLGMAS
jgi:beta-N-acetylglucosaminidase